MKIPKIRILTQKKFDEELELHKSVMAQDIIDDVLKVKGTIINTERPGFDGQYYMTVEEGVKIPILTIPFNRMYAMYKHSDILQIVVRARRREIFKNGLEIYEKFKYKCNNCEKEFEGMPDGEKCDVCGGSLHRPSIKEEFLAKGLTEDVVNENKQRLEDVFAITNKDISITDNGYILMVKEYIVGKDGKILMAIPKEIIPVSPKNVALLMDNTARPGYNDSGERLGVCVRHRNDLFVNQERCPKCNTELKLGYALCNLTQLGARHIHPRKKLYYAIDEIIHGSEFEPSLMYGESVLIALNDKLTSMIWMDRYIHEYYYKQRSPRGFFIVTTKNIESFNKSWKMTMEKLKTNPYSMAPLAIEGGGKSAQFIKFDQSLREMEYVQVRQEFRRLVGAMFSMTGIFCYAEGHEILTKEGWKNFKDLKGNEIVATLDKEMNRLEYQKIVNLWKYDFDGKMYKVKNRAIELIVSPKHKMYVKVPNRKRWSLREVEDIEGKYLVYKKNAGWIGEEQKSFTIPEYKYNRTKIKKGNGWDKENMEFGTIEKVMKSKSVKMDDWLEFLGYYLSEGYCDFGRRKYRHGCDVEISQMKSMNAEKWEKIKECLDRVGFKYTYNGKGFHIYSVQLGSYLSRFGGSRNKFIPREIFRLCNRQLKILFESLMLGDGSKGQMWSYATVSKKLADDFQELLLKIGLSGNVYYRSKTGNGCYIIGIRGWGVNSSEVSVNQKKKNDSWVRYKGKIYSVTVPNGVIYVRYNGKCVWSGNSNDMAPAGVYNESMQVTVTTRAIEHAQKLYNERFLPFLCWALGIKDWGIKLKSPESKNESKEMDIRLKKAQEAQTILSMGFDVRRDHVGNFIFGKEITRQPMMGGGGGTPQIPERSRTVPLDGEPEHSHPALEGRVEGEPETSGMFQRSVEVEKMAKPFKVPGGKHFQAKFIVPNVPTHELYVEPFLGGGSIFYKLELDTPSVLNDVNEDVVQFHGFLKNASDSDFEELHNREWVLTKNGWDELFNLELQSDVDRAYKFLYLTQGSYSGKRTHLSTSNYDIGKNKCVNVLKNLERYRDLLQNVEIYNTDWKDVVEKFDGDGVFLYLDPPYYEKTKGVLGSVSYDEIFEVCDNIKGKFLLSHNSDDLAKRFNDAGYEVVKFKTALTIGGGHNKEGREEYLMANYPINIDKTKNEKGGKDFLGNAGNKPGDIDKRIVYLTSGETPPEGARVQVGRRGGRYYESEQVSPAAQEEFEEERDVPERTKYEKIGSGLVGDVYNYDENHVLKIIKKRPVDRYGYDVDRQLMIDNERRAILYNKEKSEKYGLFPNTKEIKNGEFLKEKLYEIKDFDKIERSEKIRFGKILIQMLKDGYGLYDEVQTMQTKDVKIKVSDADGFIDIKDENERFKNSMSYKINTFLSRELGIGEWITKFPTIDKVIEAFEEGIKESEKEALTTGTSGVYSPRYGRKKPEDGQKQGVDNEKGVNISTNTTGEKNGIERCVKAICDGIGIEIQKQTMEEMAEWAKDNLFEYAFDKLSVKESDKIKDILMEDYKAEESTDTMMRHIQEEEPRIADKLTYDELDRIIQTETSALENKAKELAYLEAEAEEGRKALYRWIALGDDRMCKGLKKGEMGPCERLERDTAQGVTLKRLNDMIEEYRNKYIVYKTGPKKGQPKLKYGREYQMHPLCRCSWIKLPST